MMSGRKPAAVTHLAESGAFQLVASPEIREELVATLTKKYGWSKDWAGRACRELWDDAHWIVRPHDVQASRDPDDNYILACALETQAEFVITCGQDLPALHPFRGVSILTPAAFLARIAREQKRR